MGPSSSFDPSVFRLFGRVVGALDRVFFRYRLRGLERLPPGPCLLVANHSSIGIVDVMCLVPAWWQRFGTARRCVGMLHRAVDRMPLIGWICRSVGAIEASPGAAREALAQGLDVLVFPGGDLDSCRPFYLPRAVRFGRRRGYIRLALEAGVPVVPVATIGSHYTYLLAPGGEWVARVLGLKRWLRLENAPLPLALVGVAVAIAGLTTGRLGWPSGLALLVASLLPTPVRVTSEVLDPIDVAAETEHLTDPEERIETGHALVHGALQDAVARLRH